MNSIISIGDLPLRPKKLTEDELEGVFGGCKENGSYGCSNNKDCCSGNCYGVVSTMKYTHLQLGGIPAPFKASEFGKTKCKA